MYRAFGVSSQRSSFVLLYINDIKYTIFWMSEEVNKEFLSARYNNINGNLYQGKI